LRDLIRYPSFSPLQPWWDFPPDPADTYLHGRSGPGDLPHIPASGGLSSVIPGLSDLLGSFLGYRLQPGPALSSRSETGQEEIA